MARSLRVVCVVWWLVGGGPARTGRSKGAWCDSVCEINGLKYARKLSS